MASFKATFTCIFFVNCMPVFCGAQNFMCDASKGEYNTNREKLCPPTTTWSPEKECCVGCSVCGPGLKKKQGQCLSGCEACPTAYFSEQEHNEECYKCSDCGIVEKGFRWECEAHRDARCTECKPGIIEKVIIEYNPYKVIYKCEGEDAETTTEMSTLSTTRSSEITLQDSDAEPLQDSRKIKSPGIDITGLHTTLVVALLFLIPAGWTIYYYHTNPREKRDS